MATVSSLKDKARKEEQRGNWSRAVQLYVQALHRAEGQGDLMRELGLYNRIGDLHHRLKDTERAVESYLEAADRYEEEGLPAPAVALCNKILRLAPRRNDVRLRLMKLHLGSGLLADARQVLLEYVRRADAADQEDQSLAALLEFVAVADDEDVLVETADRLADVGRPDAATEQLERAREARAARGESVAEIEERLRRLVPGFAPRAEPIAGAPDDVSEEALEPSRPIIPPDDSREAPLEAEEFVAEEPIEEQAVPQAAAREEPVEEEPAAEELAAEEAAAEEPAEEEPAAEELAAEEAASEELVGEESVTEEPAAEEPAAEEIAPEPPRHRRGIPAVRPALVPLSLDPWGRDTIVPIGRLGTGRAVANGQGDACRDVAPTRGTAAASLELSSGSGVAPNLVLAAALDRALGKIEAVRTGAALPGGAWRELALQDLVAFDLVFGAEFRPLPGSDGAAPVRGVPGCGSFEPVGVVSADSRVIVVEPGPIAPAPIISPSAEAASSAPALPLWQPFAYQAGSPLPGRGAILTDGGPGELARPAAVFPHFVSPLPRSEETPVALAVAGRHAPVAAPSPADPGMGLEMPTRTGAAEAVPVDPSLGRPWPAEVLDPGPSWSPAPPPPDASPPDSGGAGRGLRFLRRLRRSAEPTGEGATTEPPRPDVHGVAGVRGPAVVSEGRSWKGIEVAEATSRGAFAPVGWAEMAPAGAAAAPVDVAGHEELCVVRAPWEEPPAPPLDVDSPLEHESDAATRAEAWREPAVEPEPEAEARSEPPTETEPEEELEAELEAGSELPEEPELVLGAESEPQSEAAAGQRLEEETDLESEPPTEAEAEAEIEVDVESEREPTFELAAEAGAEPRPEPPVEPEPSAEPEPEPPVEPEPLADAEAEPEAAMDSDAPAAPQPESEPSAEPVAETEIEPEPQPELAAPVDDPTEAEPEVDHEPELPLEEHEAEEPTSDSGSAPGAGGSSLTEILKERWNSGLGRDKEAETREDAETLEEPAARMSVPTEGAGATEEERDDPEDQDFSPGATYLAPSIERDEDVPNLTGMLQKMGWLGDGESDPESPDAGDVEGASDLVHPSPWKPRKGRSPNGPSSSELPGGPTVDDEVPNLTDMLHDMGWLSSSEGQEGDDPADGAAGTTGESPESGTAPGERG
jgi:hypothetical protein